MDELIMCGICLNTDVKMYKLLGYALEDYYVCIIGNLLQANISHYLQNVCYECANGLKKYNTFREKCLRSQSLLYEIVQQKEQIRKSDIKSIDRQKLKLSSNLGYGFKNIHTMELTYIKIENNLNNSMEMFKTNNSKDMIEIKIEPKFSQIEEDEGRVLDCNEEKKSFKTSIKSEETPKKLRVKKTSEQRVKNPYKKKRLKKSLEEDSSGDTSEENSEPLKRKKGPKKHPTGLTPRERKMADRFEIVKLTIEEQLEEVRKRKKTSNYIECKYKCDVCYKGFTDSSVYDNHMKRHDSLGAQHVCPICKICFETSRTLTSHRKFHEKNYKCKECSHVCNSLSQAVQHQNEHSGITYECEHCDYVTTKYSSFFGHVRKKHPSGFVCNICGFSFVSEKGLKFHKALTHNKETESENGSINMSHCKACDINFHSRQDWTKHVASLVHKMKTNDFSCDICKEAFTTAEDFKSHYHTLRHGATKKKPTVSKPKKATNESKKDSKVMNRCEACDFQCSTRQYWKKHLASVMHKIKTNDFTCDICKGQFVTAEDFESHYQMLHPMAHNKKNKPRANRKKPVLLNEWPRKCNSCDKMIPTIRKYYYHLRTTHPDQPYPVIKNHICDICGKRFRNNTLLQYHRRTHFEEKSFKCTECSKSFFSKTTLRLHQSAHSEARPYSCDICHKAYKTKNNLGRHFMSHTGEKPYPCNYCGKGFTDPTNRRTHITTVHFKMPAPYKSQKRRRPPSDVPECS